jgi:hypothetical protein
MKKPTVRILRAAGIVAAVAGIATLAGAVFGETIDPANDNSQYAFGENAGWLDAEPNGNGGDGLTVSAFKVTGWMYGENIGWVNMHCENLGTCGTVNFGVTNDNLGNLAGYAWAENAGWISFSCANEGSCGSTGNYGVKINPLTGEFTGYAWSENEGWISFSCVNDGSCLTTGDYGVRTDDGDGIAPGVDNCVFDNNPGQENNDRNFIDLSPPKAFDDLTLVNSDNFGDPCDLDDDNDGLTDAEELSGSACGGQITNPLLLDTDGDFFTDGAECLLGTNPNDITSKPTLASCGAAGDADGDGLLTQREICFFGTDPNNVNTDGDACNDGKEVASINADTAVNVIDLGQVAGEFGIYVLPGSVVKRNFDMTKDGAINVIDLSFVAGQFGVCP